MSAEIVPKSTPDERKQQRCTAPHPAKAFVWSLPAFGVALAVLLIWKFH
jgi:hypothetical protein